MLENLARKEKNNQKTGFFLGGVALLQHVEVSQPGIKPVP